MNGNTSKVQSLIENTFTSVIEKLNKDESGNLISDLYVQADAESGELQIYDDNEQLIDKVVIFDWVNSKDGEREFNKRVSATLKAVLTILSTKDAFDKPRFSKPFSISMTDEDFVVIEELLFIDDDMLRLDDPLLKDLDAELDDFLKNLLADVK